MIYATRQAAEAVCSRMNTRADYRKMEVRVCASGYMLREARQGEPTDAQIDRSQAFLAAILGG